jgi:hypothetical protein
MLTAATRVQKPLEMMKPYWLFSTATVASPPAQTRLAASPDLAATSSGPDDRGR